MSASPPLTRGTTFPLWADEIRALPTSFARSALFTVGSLKSTRAVCKDTHVASASGINMLFTGEELRQDDEDVFLQLVHLSRGRPTEEGIEFTAHAVLQQLGWSTGALGYKRLKATLDRMKRGEIKLLAKEGRRGFVGSLISSWGWREEETSNSVRAKMFVRFDSAILELFGAQPYTQLQWQERAGLSSMMAKWLHTFLITQPATRAINLEELKALSGSRAGSLRTFRETVRDALAELKANGIISDWRMSIDSVFFAMPGGDPLMKLIPGTVLDRTREEHQPA